MKERVFGRLALAYAAIMLIVQLAINFGGWVGALGDGHLIAMAGLFAATWFSGTLAIGKGQAMMGAVAMFGSTMAFLLPT